MKSIHSMIAALGFVFVLPAAAQAATSDPEVIIYRFPGVRDDGSALNAGISTVFHCTNFSGATENIRFVTRGTAAELLTNRVFSITHLATLTASTHQTVAFSSEQDLL